MEKNSLLFFVSKPMWLQFRCSTSGEGTDVEGLQTLSFSLYLCFIFFGVLEAFLNDIYIYIYIDFVCHMPCIEKKKLEGIR